MTSFYREVLAETHPPSPHMTHNVSKSRLRDLVRRPTKISFVDQAPLSPESHLMLYQILQIQRRREQLFRDSLLTLSSVAPIKWRKFPGYHI